MLAKEVIVSRWRHVAIIGLLLACPAAAKDVAERPVQWKKADGGNGHWYLGVSVPEGINWVEAQLGAVARGCRWHLATITSQDENDFVLDLVTGNAEFEVFGFWLGGFQRNATSEPDGEWRWVTQESFEFTAWRGGEPNNTALGPPDLYPGVPDGSSEDFLQFEPAATWNDLHVNGLPHGYILETEIGNPRICRGR
jgi:hypothetical protein